MNQRQILQSLLKTERPLVMPDAYDALSARLIQNAGFKAVQCSGYSMALATGCKSEDELSFERNLQITGDIIRSVNIPVMAEDEATTLAEEIPGPLSIAAGLSYNLDTLSIDALMNCGLARISLPAIAVYATIQAIKRSLRSIKEKKDLQKLKRNNLLCSIKESIPALFMSYYDKESG